MIIELFASSYWNSISLTMDVTPGEDGGILDQLTEVAISPEENRESVSWVLHGLPLGRQMPHAWDEPQIVATARALVAALEKQGFDVDLDDEYLSALKQEQKPLTPEQKADQEQRHLEQAEITP